MKQALHIYHILLDELVDRHTHGVINRTVGHKKMFDAGLKSCIDRITTIVRGIGMDQPGREQENVIKMFVIEGADGDGYPCIGYIDDYHEDDKLQMIQKIASGLEYLHHDDMVHVKPVIIHLSENISTSKYHSAMPMPNSIAQFPGKEDCFTCTNQMKASILSMLEQLDECDETQNTPWLSHKIQKLGSEGVFLTDRPNQLIVCNESDHLRQIKDSLLSVLQSIPDGDKSIQKEVQKNVFVCFQLI